MRFIITAIAALLSNVTASPLAVPAPHSMNGGRSTPTACVNQVGNGPHVDTDTVLGFKSYAAFAAAASAAAASPPAFYDVVPGWVNLQGSANAPGYLTYIQSQLTSYEPNVCANYCANKISGCASFVIYYERDAQLVNRNTGTPDSALGCPGLATSPSVTLIKCAFYSAFLDSSSATNTGQYQDDFQVAIAGSTAFNLVAPTFSGFDVPTYLDDAALNIPLHIVENDYLVRLPKTVFFIYSEALDLT